MRQVTNRRGLRVDFSMKSTLRTLFLASLFQPAWLFAQPGLTIYGGKFASVRDSVPLELKAGMNQVRYSGVTAGVDATSVILRDPSGKVAFSILEQDYLNGPVNQNALLELFEGQVVGFLIRDSNGALSTVDGKIVRAGREAAEDGTALPPIIEYGGRLLFDLPGRPLFPSLKDDALLKPVLTWKIQSPAPASFDAEVSYLSSGLSWEAAYNLMVDSSGQKGDLHCWVTIRNNSGKSFDDAQIKLVAGDVHRASPERENTVYAVKESAADGPRPLEPEVQGKKFEDWHKYTLPRPVSLRDSSVKQVEFARANSVPVRRIYTFDGAPSVYGGTANLEKDWMEESLEKVDVQMEFENREESGLGIPLPGGLVRVYRRDGSQVEFAGEDRATHTAQKERVKLLLGSAFDLSGKRRRVDFRVDQRARSLEESFEIVLKNAGKTPVEITVVEHLSRTASWKITRQSAQSTPVDASTVHFQIPVAAESELTLSYAVRYTW